MPEMNGEITTRHIRKLANPKKANIPIIAVSAAAFKGEVDQYLESGMNDFIIKPYTEEKLLEVINRVLKISEPETYQLTNASLKNSKKQKKLYDLSRLLEFSEDDPAFIKEIISVFITNTGKDAIDLSKAVEDMDMPAIFQIAHRMKSSFHTMGVHSLESHIKNLEFLAKNNESPDQIKMLSTIVNKTIYLVFDQLKKDFA